MLLRVPPLTYPTVPSRSELDLKKLAACGLILQELKAASYDGSIIFKIDGYNEKKESGAVQESLPFYTSRYGYKMVLRVRQCTFFR